MTYFGTVVDWHGSIVREVGALYPQVDANAFALAWRAGYEPAMQRVRSGELGWTRIDELHRLILDQHPARLWSGAPEREPSGNTSTGSGTGSRPGPTAWPDSPG